MDQVDYAERMQLLEFVRGCTFDDFLLIPQCGVLPRRDPDSVDLSAETAEKRRTLLAQYGLSDEQRKRLLQLRLRQQQLQKLKVGGTLTLLIQSEIQLVLIVESCR